MASSSLLPTRSQVWRVSRVFRSGRGTRLLSTQPPKKPPSPVAGSKKPNLEQNVDPHAMASDMISKNYTSRIQGTEAIQNHVTPEQRMKNVALAGTLFAFVGCVWWYSMNAVGQSQDDSLESLASEARLAKNASSISQQEAEKLANLDMGVMEKDELNEDVTLAVAAPDDIAKQQEEENKAALASKQGNNASNKRPLWKRIIFFWKPL